MNKDPAVPLYSTPTRSTAPHSASSYAPATESADPSHFGNTPFDATPDTSPVGSLSPGAVSLDGFVVDARAVRGKRLVFVINSLEGGGAERVLSLLLTWMSESLVGVELILVLLDQHEEKYEIPTQIRKIVLNCQGGFLKSVLGLQRCLHRLQPDMVLSFLNRANCANVLAAKRLNYRCLISERVNTSSHFGNSLKGRINKWLVRLLYPMATRVLAVSQGVAQDLASNFAVSAAKLQVIYNPYNLSDLRTQGTLEPPFTMDGDFIISVGRLVPNKNFELLIRAYHQAQPPEKLLILGEGPERENLQTLINELGLTERVKLGGFADNPYTFMARARYAVFSSSAEGFPNALAESMAFGLPIIATDCDSGPAEILHEQIHVHQTDAFRAKYGILVPVGQVEPLAKAMRWMQEEDTRAYYHQRSLERIPNFSIEYACAQYRDALLQTMMSAQLVR